MLVFVYVFLVSCLLLLCRYVKMCKAVWYIKKAAAKKATNLPPRIDLSMSLCQTLQNADTQIAIDKFKLD